MRPFKEALAHLEWGKTSHCYRAEIEPVVDVARRVLTPITDDEKWRAASSIVKALTPQQLVTMSALEMAEMVLGQFLDGRWPERKE